MTLESTINKNRYIGNGATTQFPFTFKIWKADQILVYVGDGTRETEVSSQCFVEITPTGGTVTFPSAPRSGSVIVIRRKMPYIQEDDYQNGARFNPEEIEGRFDEDCAERQDLLSDIERAVKVPETSAQKPEELFSSFVNLAASIEQSKNQIAEWIEAIGSSVAGSATPVVATGTDTPRTLADRAADIVNVRDYGAVGDGITNDTSAIQAAFAAANGRAVFMPAGSYLVTSPIDGVAFSDGSVEINPSYAPHIINKGVFNGGTRSIFVDATNGDDSNDGKTDATALKTVDKAISITNTGTNAQYSIYLMGSNVYDVSSSYYVFGHACPHFNAYNGSPTLNFKYSGGSGPRFYAGHVALNGTGDYKLNIDADYGSLYFEGCAVGVWNVNFKVPVRTVGCTLWGENVGLTSKIGTYNGYGLTCSYSIARLTGTTTITREATSNLNAIMANHSSVLALYGTVNFADGTAGATGNFVAASHSVFFGSFSSEQFTVSPVLDAYLLSLEESIVYLDLAIYNAALSAGLQNMRSAIHVNGVDVSSQMLKGTHSLGELCYCPGCLTSDSESINFTVPLPKRVFGTSSVSLSFEKINVRGVSGYIVTNGTPNTLTYSVSNSNGMVTGIITLDQAASTTNNTPVSVQISNGVLTVS